MGSVVMVVRTSGSLVVHVMMGCKLNSLVNVKNVLSPSQATDDPAEEAGGHVEAEGSAIAAVEEADGAAAARDDVAALMVAADTQPPQGSVIRATSSGSALASPLRGCIACGTVPLTRPCARSTSSAP